MVYVLMPGFKKLVFLHTIKTSLTKNNKVLFHQKIQHVLS